MSRLYNDMNRHWINRFDGTAAGLGCKSPDFAQKINLSKEKVGSDYRSSEPVHVMITK